MKARLYGMINQSRLWFRLYPYIAEEPPVIPPDDEDNFGDDDNDD